MNKTNKKINEAFKNRKKTDLVLAQIFPGFIHGVRRRIVLKKIKSIKKINKAFNEALLAPVDSGLLHTAYNKPFSDDTLRDSVGSKRTSFRFEKYEPKS